jgi:GntR family phosphonate transport system transcriptional regulator
VSAGDEAATRWLGLASQAPVARLELVSEVDGLPILYAVHCFCATRFPGLADAFRRTRSISAALRDHGVEDYTRAWTRITARSPSRVVAAHLMQPENQPVLRAEGLNTDIGGGPLEYAIGWWSGARAQFVIGD